LEAIDEEGLKAHRKRVTLSKNLETLECARKMGITVAVNIIADPAWEEAHFVAVREWAQSVPEIVHLTVNTPYPGTETWITESRRLTTRDYRLFDVQHAVLPTKLRIEKFYEELVQTQQVLNMKHLGWSAFREVMALAARRLLHGQTNFVKMLGKFNKVYNAQRQLADHQREVHYEIELPKSQQTASPEVLYIHPQSLLEPIRTRLAG
jgi:hopanoid C-3 methylase